MLICTDLDKNIRVISSGRDDVRTFELGAGTGHSCFKVQASTKHSVVSYSCFTSLSQSVSLWLGDDEAIPPPKYEI